MPIPLPLPMPPISEIRSWIELAILLFLLSKAVGGKIQQSDDRSTAQTVRLEGHEQKLSVLDEWVRSLREINIAQRLSRAESTALNLETRLRDEFVSKAVCNERTAGAAKERNHDHPHG